MLKLYSIILCALFAGAMSPMQAQEIEKSSNELIEPKNVQAFSLDNGLQVIMEKDTRSPVVVSQIWYRIGSSFEKTGTTGISHVLEHMMFKNTSKFKTGEVSQLVARYGGSENAFTSRDYTGYYQLWEKSRLPISFAIEAERMVNLTIDPEEFRKEVKVVEEERRTRTDDNPFGTAFERFNAAAYVSSPYQSPIIGWMHDIQSLSVEQTKDWYRHWYSPNNAILVVVGDIDFDEVKQLAETYFAGIEAQELPDFPNYKEVPPKGQKRLIVKDNVTVPSLMMGWLVPSLKTAEQQEDALGLSILAQVLDGGLSARFETELVRDKKIAASIGTNYNPLTRGDSQFFIQATPAEGVSLEALEKAILGVIEAVAKEGPSEKELSRIIAQLSASDIYAKDSLYAKAQAIGQLAVIDVDWRLAYQGVSLYENLSPKTIQNLAQEFLIEDRSTVLTLLPAMKDDQS